MASTRRVAAASPCSWCAFLTLYSSSFWSSTANRSPARCSGLQDKLSTLSDGYNRRGRPVRVATTRRTRSLEETGAALAMQRARTRRKYAAAAESAQWP